MKRCNDAMMAQAVAQSRACSIQKEAQASRWALHLRGAASHFLVSLLSSPTHDLEPGRIDDILSHLKLPKSEQPSSTLSSCLPTKSSLPSPSPSLVRPAKAPSKAALLVRRIFFGPLLVPPYLTRICSHRSEHARQAEESRRQDHRDLRQAP